MSAVAAQIAKRCCFVGGGSMASAMVRGITASGLMHTDQITVSSPVFSQELLQMDEQQVGLTLSADNGASVKEAELVFLCVKPDILPIATESIAEVINETQLFFSIAAGTPCEKVETFLRSNKLQKPRVIRVMPNTPCAVGEGAFTACKGTHATDEDLELALELLSPLGEVLPIPESLMDAATGLAGSGPAFVYIMIESLADGGVRAGLPRETALRLAAQTVRGAASMILGKHGNYEATDTTSQLLSPAVLKDAVCSPGGTTISGVESCEQTGLRTSVVQAVMASANRSKAISEGILPLTGQSR
eukprot:gb/GECG01003119.1/.p1 GENE.gb/GECG01003119.1/~~gb/GECG01003119.1/.p1  ORF type:complete len:304 (+),score=32.73 gb/GECG01003119.1/:1-912(+)